MKTVLNPSWELSTEHAAGYGQPLLVRRSTGEAYGPGDLVKLYPSLNPRPAAEAVARLAKRSKLDAEGRALAERFMRSVPR